MNADIPSREGTDQAASINDSAIAGAVGKLLEHPELISMVASAIGADTSKLGASPPPTAQNENAQNAEPVSADVPATPDAVSTLMPMLSKLSSLGFDKGKSGFKHEQLLIALKPYVSKNRCDAIDYMLRLSRISGLIGGLGGKNVFETK